MLVYHPTPGRDLVGGGTWLGVSRSGKFATVTNIPSLWDELLDVAHGQTRSMMLASTVVAAAATALAVVRRKQGDGWASSIGLLCAGMLTASVGIAVAARAAARRSRGPLVADFLKGDENAQQYCLRLSKARKEKGIEQGRIGAWVYFPLTVTIARFPTLFGLGLMGERKLSRCRMQFCVTKYIAKRNTTHCLFTNHASCAQCRAMTAASLLDGRCETS